MAETDPIDDELAGLVADFQRASTDHPRPATERLEQAHELVALADTPRYAGKPRRVCAHHEIIKIRSSIDETGYADINLKALEELSTETEPDSQCTFCLLGSKADALVGARRLDVADRVLVDAIGKLGALGGLWPRLRQAHFLWERLRLALMRGKRTLAEDLSGQLIRLDHKLIGILEPHESCARVVANAREQIAEAELMTCILTDDPCTVRPRVERYWETYGDGGIGMAQVMLVLVRRLEDDELYSDVLALSSTLLGHLNQRGFSRTELEVRLHRLRAMWRTGERSTTRLEAELDAIDALFEQIPSRDLERFAADLAEEVGLL